MDIKEDFTQLRLRFTDPVQHDYDVIRPVVLSTCNSHGLSISTGMSAFSAFIFTPSVV